MKRILTFGQPKVIAAKDFSSCNLLGLLRILLPKDPALSFFDNYSHAGQQLVLNSKPQLESMPSFGDQVSVPVKVHHLIPEPYFISLARVSIFSFWSSSSSWRTFRSVSGYHGCWLTDLLDSQEYFEKRLLDIARLFSRRLFKSSLTREALSRKKLNRSHLSSFISHQLGFSNVNIRHTLVEIKQIFFAHRRHQALFFSSIATIFP